MKKLFGLLASLAIVSASQAQILPSGAQQVQGTEAPNRGYPVNVQLVNGSGVAGGTVQGTSASGAVDDGSFPVKVGGVVATSNISAGTSGNRTNFISDLYGNQRVVLGALPTGGGDAFSNTGVGWVGQDSSITAGNRLLLATGLWYFNGTSFDRMRGDTTGIWSGGHAALNTNQVSATTSATLIAAARTGRQKIIVSLGAANDCFFGGSGVTNTTGFRVKGVDGASLTLDTAAALYAVCASATTISFIELY